jgi:membrane protease YdiL (CAAX protease family)
MPSTEQIAKRHLTTRTLLELLVAYTLILITAWTSGRTQRFLFYASGGWILLNSIFPRRTRKLVGFRLSGLQHSWWIAATVLAAGGFAVAIAADVGTLQLPSRIEQLPVRIFGYVVWSFVQQYILQDYFLQRLRRLTAHTSIAVVTTGLLFALAHLPNPLLTIAALVWGVTSCALFMRYRDIYSLGVAHAVLGLCIAFTVPDAMHHGMRVGSGYMTYHARPASHSTQPE